MSLLTTNIKGEAIKSHCYGIINVFMSMIFVDISNLQDGLYSIQVQERGKSMQSIKLLKQS